MVCKCGNTVAAPLVAGNLPPSGHAGDKKLRQWQNNGTKGKNKPRPNIIDKRLFGRIWISPNCIWTYNQALLYALAPPLRLLLMWPFSESKNSPKYKIFEMFIIIRPGGVSVIFILYVTFKYIWQDVSNVEVPNLYFFPFSLNKMENICCIFYFLNVVRRINSWLPPCSWQETL